MTVLMPTVENLKQHYGPKMKTVADLVRFIENRIDHKNPNFSLFLGAGCSVSSGIRSATSLCETWKKEIGEETPFYAPTNEYGHLFEKRYDLPKQRRMFVENEIKNKKPGIGYAYLVKLIEASYFKTIFTTNFDDLANQAFYNYGSEIRPIVCAHDSSINSIAITSERPKIIKLHGDYLFDDIKSTIRETESLEDNMRNKFIEFAKDYGLVVAGYGGNDRSIMDVLNHLLKHEEYFGHGIYWCVRAGSQISNELFQLGAKERVYFVEIGGFDEFMAELNSHLNSSRLPLEAKVNNTSTDILKEIRTYKEKFSDCSQIIKDLKECEAQLRINALVGGQSLTEIIDGAKGSAPKKFEESCYCAEVKEKISIGKLDDAIKAAQLHLAKSLESYETVRELSLLLAYCHRKKGDLAKIISTLKSLIDYMNEKKVGNTSLIYYRMAQTYEENEQLFDALRELENAIKIDAFHSDFYAMKAHAIQRILEEAPEEAAFIKDDVIENYKRSIELDSSIENKSYVYLAEYYLEQEDLPQAEDILKKLALLDPYHLKVVKLKTEIMEKEKTTYEKVAEYLDEVSGLNGLYSRAQEYDYLYLRAQKKHNKLPQLKKTLNKIEQNYPVDLRAITTKAEILLRNFRDMSGAVSILENALGDYEKATFQTESSLSAKRTLFDWYLYLNEPEKALSIYKSLEEESFDKLSQKERAGMLLDHAGIAKDYDALKAVVTSYAYVKDIQFYMQVSFNLLKMEKYSEVVELLKPFLGKINYSNSILNVNYELAQKFTGKVHAKRVAKILDDKNASKTLKAAAHILLNEKEKAKNLLIEEIKQNYNNFYMCSNFPVFKEISFNELQQPVISFDSLEAEDQNLHLVKSA